MSQPFGTWLDPSDAHAVQTLWRRGTRSAVIGVAIGAGVTILLGVGLGVLLTLVSRDADQSLGIADLVALAPEAVTPLVLGAMVGLTVGGMSVGRILVAIAGAGPDGKRIRNHVLKGTPAGSPEDAEKALRWAQIAAVYLPYQALSLGLLYAGLLANQVTQLLNRPHPDGLWWFSLVIAVLLACFALVLFPLQLRSARRARRYRDLHAIDIAEEIR